MNAYPVGTTADGGWLASGTGSLLGQGYPASSRKYPFATRVWSNHAQRAEDLTRDAEACRVPYQRDIHTSTMPIATAPDDKDKVKICIDRGGTFCDVIAISETKGNHIVKLLSVDPSQ